MPKPISTILTDQPVETPYLTEYTDDLTAEAAANPDRFQAIARNQEIAQVVYNLSRRTKNNPILVGEAGVGKTAIVEGLARLIALKQAGERLNKKKIRVLQIAALGQQDPVMKMLKIIDELKVTKGQNILFIDEVHTIMGVDQGGGALDLGDVLKPAMARGDIQLIGSTTLDEYDKFIERDPALQRRFQEVIVNEPTQADALIILKGIQTRYEQYHHVSYSDEAVQACVALSVRYIADRFLPDKAIDLMDQAGAIAEARDKHEIGLREIAEVLQEMRGIPITNVLRNDSSRLKNMRARLGKTVKGQAEAISEVTNAITVAKAGLQSPDRPLSSFLFLGTSGTGKTALTRALAKVMFDSEDAMIRLDMSEFSERDAIEHFQDLVTTQVKRQPYCILLFDEIEKASTAVHDRLLQVLDAGELRDKRGHSTNFRNTIIIMTTNLGAELISDKQAYQENLKNDDQATANQLARRQAAFRREVQMELTNVFRPEFVNRIEHKIVFNMLTRNIIRQIAINNLNTLNERMKNHGFKLIFGDKLVDFLADIGTDVANGARPLQRAVETEVAAPLSMLVLRLSADPNNRIHTIRATVSGEAPKYALQQHHRGTRKIKFSGVEDRFVDAHAYAKEQTRKEVM